MTDPDKRLCELLLQIDEDGTIDEDGSNESQVRDYYAVLEKNIPTLIEPDGERRWKLTAEGRGTLNKCRER
jgi:hypothetical protein